MDDHIESYGEQNDATDKPDGKNETFVTTIRTPEAIRVEAETKERKTKKEKIVWWTLRVVEIGGVIAVIAYTIVTFQLWHEAKKTTRAAENSLKESRNQSHLQARALALGNGAYLEPIWAHIDFEKGEGPFNVWMSVKNNGKTKAIFQSAIGQVDFLSSPPICTNDRAKPINFNNVTTLDVEDKPVTVGFRFDDWPQDAYTAFHKKQTRLYVWGEFRFTDRLGWQEAFPFCRYATLIPDRRTASFPCDCWDTEKNKETDKKGKKNHDPAWNCSQ